MGFLVLLLLLIGNWSELIGPLPDTTEIVPPNNFLPDKKLYLALIGRCVSLVCLVSLPIVDIPFHSVHHGSTLAHAL